MHLLHLVIPDLYSAIHSSIRLTTLCRFLFSSNYMIAAGKYLDKITYLLIVSRKLFGWRQSQAS